MRAFAAAVLAVLQMGTTPPASHRHYPGWWLRQAACIRYHESRGHWHEHGGGAYQFLLSTWRSVQGRGNPRWAAPAEQTYRAHRVWARDGGSWREWTTGSLCS